MNNRKQLPDFDLLWHLFGYSLSNNKIVWKNPNKYTHCVKVGDFAGTLHHTGRLIITINGSQYAYHNILWKMFTGRDPVGDIDHLDHKPLNNKMSNLEDTFDNVKNQKIRSTNKSGVMGVSYEKANPNKPWCVYIKKKRYGNFKTLQEAEIKSKEVYKQLGFHKNHGLF